MGVLMPFDAPGGGQSVRGVLLQRYHGKLKALLSFELRGNAPWFSVAGERFRIGPVAFADAGRVWADWRRSQAGRA